MKKRGLPKGWVYKKLGEISKIRSGGTPSRSCPEYWSNGTIPWVKIGDMSSKYVEKTQEKISHSGLDNSAAKLLEKDTLLISIFATLGEVSILKIDAACNQAIAGITVDPKLISTDYLYYYLIHIKNNIKDRGRGVAQNNINLSILNNTQIVVPPLETQQKIVAILDKAEEIKRLRAEANAQTQKLIQSVFLDMFGDPVKNPKGWSTSRIGDVTSKISSGSTPLGGREVYSKSGKLFIRSQNVLMNRLNLDDVAYIDNATHTNMKRTWVNCGDVLLNITGASIGRVAWYDGENGSANVNQHVCIIRPNHKMILPEVLAFQISMPSFQQKIMMKQSGATRQAFTFTQISDFKIILPDLALQNHFLSIMRAINGVGQKQKEQDSQLLLNKNNLLSNAFNGELVA